MENTLTHEFTMPIGDWSDDGHGKCDYFIFKSNKPVEEVREAHFKIRNATGIDISEVCSEYEDAIVKEDVMDKLKQLDFDFEDFEDNCPSSQGMARMWAFLLQKADTSLTLELVEDKRPMLIFYGFDSQQRHISGPGYGLFY